jgi:hypothetical protein
MHILVLLYWNDFFPLSLSLSLGTLGIACLN